MLHSNTLAQPSCMDVDRTRRKCKVLPYWHELFYIVTLPESQKVPAKRLCDLACKVGYKGLPVCLPPEYHFGLGRSKHSGGEYKVASRGIGHQEPAQELWGIQARFGEGFVPKKQVRVSNLQLRKFVKSSKGRCLPHKCPYVKVIRRERTMVKDECLELRSFRH